MALNVDDILNFLKGFVPGYAAIENLIAPVFGIDVDDYGQCRANCGDSTDKWPAVIVTCNSCVDKISREAVFKLLPELAGAGTGSAAGLALSLTGDVIRKAIIAWAEKKGLSFIATKVIPGLGLIFLLGDLANLIVILVTLKRIMDAAAAAKKKFCVCP